MALTPHDIDRIAHLARLELSPQKSEQMRTQLNDFFGMVAQMQTVDTAGNEPLSHPVAVLQDVQLRLQDDVATETNQRDAYLRNAPAAEQGLFLVPKVIE